ncbi:hypothetical protein BDV95DRAFT_229560 [Massariosphaeria phaeospora]|uniref:Uncharacterized protein n=1 Tax=Massariosphaeria phaeospora TaxID=100035 RepID=A0A7C8ICZ3_9PLEO|nr:hypothetical protein BDV95DRAFT_229560 [Massariosphaeria phaeospora]
MQRQLTHPTKAGNMPRGTQPRTASRIAKKASKKASKKAHQKEIQRKTPTRTAKDKPMIYVTDEIPAEVTDMANASRSTADYRRCLEKMYRAMKDLRRYRLDTLLTNAARAFLAKPEARVLIKTSIEDYAVPGVLEVFGQEGEIDIEDAVERLLNIPECQPGDFPGIYVIIGLPETRSGSVSDVQVVLYVGSSKKRIISRAEAHEIPSKTKREFQKQCNTHLGPHAWIKTFVVMRLPEGGQEKEEEAALTLFMEQLGTRAPPNRYTGCPQGWRDMDSNGLIQISGAVGTNRSEPLGGTPLSTKRQFGK